MPIGYARVSKAARLAVVFAEENFTAGGMS